MICPKCGKEMEYGEIGVDAFSRGMPTLFWAPKQVFNRLLPGTLTAKKAEAEGGMKIKLGNGALNNRTAGYVCKECKCVLLDLS